MHSLNILYRDLKPENILVDKDGNIKLTDFGLSKEIIEDFYHSRSFVGTHAYLAPEILSRRPHGKSIDWYGVGAILYEFLVGIPPYFDPDQDRLYENIMNGALKIPVHRMSKPCLDLILRLLKRNPLERLGAQGANEIKAHAWFTGVDWQEVYDKRVYVDQYPRRKLSSNPEKCDLTELRQTNKQPFHSYDDPELDQVAGWDFYNNQI